MEIYRTLNRKIDDYFGIPFLPAWQQMQPRGLGLQPASQPARPSARLERPLPPRRHRLWRPDFNSNFAFLFFYTAHHNGYILLAITLLFPDIQNWVNLGVLILTVHRTLQELYGQIWKKYYDGRWFQNGLKMRFQLTNLNSSAVQVF